MSERTEMGRPEGALSLQNILWLKDEEKYRERRDAFVRARLKGLIGEITPIVIEAKRLGMHEGFIHPDSVIHVTEHEMIPGFRIDDVSIFADLIDRLRTAASIPDAVQRVIDGYFGVDHAAPDLTTSDRRVKTYGGRKPDAHLSMRDVADAHVAMCAEKSAMAQNLITFLGNRSWLMDSYAMIARRDGVVDKGQHLYNVIETSSQSFVLYDASHPFEVINEGVVIDVKPAQFNISAEEFASLRSGGELRLKHREEHLEEVDGTVTERTHSYGGSGSMRRA